MQRLPVIAVDHTGILAAAEPKIVRLLLPFSRSDWFKRRKGSSVEFADALVRIKVEVPVFVFLDAVNIVPRQSVPGRKPRDRLAVVTEYAFATAREPMAAVSCLEDVKKVLCHFGNGFASGDSRLPVRQFGRRSFVLPGSKGWQCRDEGECNQRAQALKATA